jgi:hypothetical protein
VVGSDSPTAVATEAVALCPQSNSTSTGQFEYKQTSSGLNFNIMILLGF